MSFEQLFPFLLHQWFWPCDNSSYCNRHEHLLVGQGSSWWQNWWTSLRSTANQLKHNSRLVHGGDTIIEIQKLAEWSCVYHFCFWRLRVGCLHSANIDFACGYLLSNSFIQILHLCALESNLVGKHAMVIEPLTSLYPGTCIWVPTSLGIDNHKQC